MVAPLLIKIIHNLRVAKQPRDRREREKQWGINTSLCKRERDKRVSKIVVRDPPPRTHLDGRAKLRLFSEQTC